jgi:DNA-binding IclR family transcriptional regulator
MESVQSCKTRGYSVVRGIWIPGAHSAGIPSLRDKNGECFAMNCRVPVFRLQESQIEEDIAPRLISLAESIRNHPVFIFP